MSELKKKKAGIVRIGQSCIFVAAIGSCGAEATFVCCGCKG